MKLFNLFDKQGNKVGTVESGDSSSGMEAVFKTLFLIIIGMGSFIVWPGFFVQLAHSNIEEKMLGICWLLVIIVSLLFCARKDYIQDDFNFTFMWAKSVFCATCIGGIGGWIILGISEGTITFRFLLASAFLSFLLSIWSGFITTLTVFLVRKKNKNE